MKEKNDKLLTIKEVAEILRVSTRTVWPVILNLESLRLLKLVSGE